MKKYDVIAFDLDGTLSDPENGLIEGFIYAFKKMGVTEYGDRESLRRFIGPSLYVVWQDEFGFNETTVVEAIEKFREYYNIYGWWDNKVYAGIHDMLATLKAEGKTLVLATSKPEDTAVKIMKLFGLVGRQGVSLIPLSLYFSGKNLKLSLGVCRGKKLYDKRETEAKKQMARDVERASREKY